MTVRKVLILALAAVATLYVACLCGLFFLQAALIFPGARNPVAALAPQSGGAELLRITVPRASVDALFLPATDSAAGAKPVVVFAHGNGEVIDWWLSGLDGFRERGIGVLLVEYPGYGRSSGSPSEASIRAVLAAAYDRIVSDARVDRTRVLGFGQSLGGGAICLLARDRPLRALILQSTFTSLDTFTSAYGAPALLLRSHFDSLTSLSRYAGPVLVIHGRKDPVIPWQQGRQLAAAARSATFRLYDCGHVCWDPQHQPFWRDAVPFLEAAGILARR